MLRWSTILILAAFLCGCATGPAYRAAPQPSDYGYRDTQLTSQRFRVSFSGDYTTARETVENFALYRAAQVALAHGQSHFRITSRETTPVTGFSDVGPTATLGYGWGYPFYGAGLGYPGGGYSRTRYDTVLHIQIGPDVPEHAANVYNANEIKRNLASTVAKGDG